MYKNAKYYKQHPDVVLYNPCHSVKAFFLLSFPIFGLGLVGKLIKDNDSKVR